MASRPQRGPSLMHHPLVKALNPREVQLEVEAEPAAMGDRVLIRRVTVYNQSEVDLGPSLTLTAEATELWHLERVPVGSLARGERRLVTLRLRVKTDLRRPFEDAIPETYVLTLQHASPIPGGGVSPSLPPLAVAYRFPSSMRSYLCGLPGMAPRRLVTLPSETDANDDDDAAASQQRPHAAAAATAGQRSRRPRPAPCNLLLIGPAGAGKSTLLAHFLTLLSDRERVNLGGVRTCSTSEHGTLELRAYPLPNVSSVAVWDTRGITSSNYLRGEIRCILEGVFPEKGLDIEQMDAAQAEAVAAAGRATRAFRRQQAVIVVIPEGLLQSRVELDHLRRQLQHVQCAGLNPLVCLTHVDLAYPVLRQNPNADVPDLKESRREAARQLGVEANRVLHFVPYKDEELRRFCIDRLSYKVLSTALQLAAEYVESDEPFLGAADGLIIDTFFPPPSHSHRRRESDTTHATTSSGAHIRPSTIAAAAAGRPSLSSPVPSADADLVSPGISPLQRFFLPSSMVLPRAVAPAAAAGVAAGAESPPAARQWPTEDPTVVVMDRSRGGGMGLPPPITRSASDGTEAYDTSGGNEGVGVGGGMYRWEDEDGDDGFDDGVSSLHGSFYSEDGTFPEPYMRPQSQPHGGGMQIGQGL